MRYFIKSIYLLPALLFITLFYNNLGSGWRFYENTYLTWLTSSVVILIILVSLIISKQKLPLFSNIDFVVILFLTYALIHLLIEGSFSLHHGNVIKGFLCILFYFLFKVLFQATHGKKLFVLIIILSASLEALHGLGQWTHVLPKGSNSFLITGAFNNSGTYSGFLVGTSAFLYYFFRKPINKSFQFLGVVIATGCAIILIVDQSRAAWFGAIAILVFIVGHKISDRLIIKPKWIWALLPLVIIIFAVIPYKQNSAIGRVLIWKVSLEMWKESPLFGIGPGQFAQRYNEYQAKFFLTNANEDKYALVADNTYYAFNEFIEILVEYGIVGFILHSALLLLVWRTGGKTEENDDGLLMARGALLGITVFSFFSYPFASIPICFVFAGALAMVSDRCHSKNLNYVTRSVTMNSIILSAMAILVLFTSREIYLRLKAVKNWNEAYVLLKSEQEEDAWQLYQNTHTVLVDHGGFLFNYGSELLEAGHYNEGRKILENSKLFFSHIDLYVALGECYQHLNRFADAEREYMFAAEMIPSRLYPKYMLVKLYLQQGEKEKARNWAKRLIRTKVKIPSPETSAMIKEMEEFIRNHE